MKCYIILDVILFLLCFTLGYYVRGCNIKQEVKEESIKRIAYALQSGMLTVNHDKIIEISKSQNAKKTRITKLTEAIQSQVDTNQVTVKSEDNFADSNIICSTNNENKVKLPEEG
jgi:hypothetical protein